MIYRLRRYHAIKVNYPVNGVGPKDCHSEDSEVCQFLSFYNKTACFELKSLRRCSKTDPESPETRAEGGGWSMKYKTLRLVKGEQKGY